MGKDTEIIVPDAKDAKKQAKKARKEQKEGMLRKVRESYYVAGIAYAVLGLGMLIVPEHINAALSYILGGVLIFYAIIALIRFFIETEDKKNLLQLDFIVGALMAVAGVLIIMLPRIILDLMPLMFGILLVFGSIVNFQDAYELKRLKWSKWKWFMLMAGVTLITGIVFVCLAKFNNLIFTRVIGAAFAFIGINSAVGNIAVGVKQKQAAKEVLNK